MRKQVLTILFGSTFIFGCSGGSGGGSAPPPPPPPPPPPLTVTLEGVAEKGPFTRGASVSVHSLTPSGARDAVVANIVTTDDLGAFSAEVDANQSVEVEVVGRFMDELDGGNSSSPIALGAIVRAGAGGNAASNVNVLTHLAAPRHRVLLSDSTVNGPAAEIQARSDVLLALDSIVPSPAIDSLHSASIFSDVPNDATSAYLVALSAMLSQHARELALANGTDFAAELQALLDTLAQDLGDGTLDETSLAAGVRDAAYVINPVAVDTNLRNLAATAGSSQLPGNILLFLDSDRDGTVNYFDDDDDNDGIEDTSDAYPLDWSCFLESQGDGTTCTVDTTIPSAYQTAKIVEDDAGVLYLLDDAGSRIFRWSPDRQSYGWTLDIPDGATAMTYSSAHDRIYVGYASGDIVAIEVGGTYNLSTFAALGEPILELGAAGDFLLAADADGDGTTLSIAGAFIDRARMDVRAGSLDWNDELNHVIWIDRGSSDRVERLAINPANGMINSTPSYPRHSIFDAGEVLRVSNDGDQFVIGGGDVFNSVSFDWQVSIPGDFIDIAWVGADTLVGIMFDAGGTRLQHMELHGDIIEYGLFAGAPVQIFRRAQHIVVITQTERPEFHSFVLGGDIDDDSVVNNLDAFPMDPAASADTDRDGYPDDWNDGSTAADSTTGLEIDAYPNDSICYLPGHGDGTTCNIAGNIPAYAPDWVVSDNRGVVYLLNQAHARIFRWDTTTGHMNPLVTHPGDVPELLRYSPENDRLYLSYVSGRIGFWDPTISVSEKYFSGMPTRARGMQPAGDFLWTGARETGSTASYGLSFRADGTAANLRSFATYYSEHSAWNSGLDRVYTFRGGIPDDITYQAVDQLTGTLDRAEDSPYHGSYSIDPPIRMALDGSAVLLGSGDIYNASDLTHIGAIPGGFIDALWIDQNETLVVGRAGGDTQLQRRTANGAVIETASFTGPPIALLRAGSAFTVVTGQSGGPTFHRFAPSDDSDGDGVANSEDAFPLDAAASMDSDGDGYPDAWNPGMTAADSTTGLTLDAYPDDTACYLPEHGDGTTCDITATMPNYIPASMAVDDNGILYLFSPDNRRVFRRDLATGDHLNPIVIGDQAWLASSTPKHMVYHSGHGRLYFSYDNNDVTYVDIATDTGESWFATTSGSIGGLADVGDYLLVQDDSGNLTHNIFDAGGALRASEDRNRESPAYAWNPVLDRVYFYSRILFPGSLVYEDVDQNTGAITGDGGAALNGDPMGRPIRVSSDGARVLTANGDIFDADSMSWLSAIPGGFVDAQWTADGEIVTIRDSAGNTQLLRRDTDGEILDGADFTGVPLALFPMASGFIIVIDDGVPAIIEYMPSDDTDNDGVPNDQDAFPTDRAASVDSDGDGYPDSWNPGMTEADSTTGLTLDAYPNDTACFLPEHGDGVTCDVTSTIPDYVPASAAVDAAGVVYLFSPQNNKVYRWDSVNQQHLNPFIVGISDWLGRTVPSLMTYHEGHNRLYFAYFSGRINYIDLAGPPTETFFATLTHSVRGMADAGNFLFVQDGTGSSVPHHTYDVNGVLMATRNGSYYSRTYGFNDALSRIYFFPDSSSAGQLRYEDIDQGSGAILAAGQSPYSSDFGLAPPIRVSPDGTQVVIGTGDIYTADNLTWTATLPGGFADLQWVDSSSLVALLYDGADSRVDRLSATGQLLETNRYAGSALFVLPSDTGYVVVTNMGRPAFYAYAPSDDTDGDGTPNPVDVFPTDIAAAADTDGDGYPDAWNVGMTEADSTTGLTLDPYPDDSACYLLAHGDGITCDRAAAIPNYTPNRVFGDANGVIYLLSAANNRIYRWSPAGGHLNPLVVNFPGYGSIINVTHSPETNRVYAIRSSGTITYWDLAAPAQENYFSTTPTPARGLQAAGAFLWTAGKKHGSTGRFNLLYDHVGNVAQYYNSTTEFSDDTAWNDSLNRVYLFRDRSTPYDILFQDVDQVTGMVSRPTDSPYHGTYSILPPIRLSPDDAKVLLGSGDIYNALDLVWLDAIPGGFTDAQWLTNETTAVVHGSGTTTMLILRDASGASLEVRNFPGAPLAIVPAPGGATVVTDQGQPAFNTFVPTSN